MRRRVHKRRVGASTVGADGGGGGQWWSLLEVEDRDKKDIDPTFSLLKSEKQNKIIVRCHTTNNTIS